MPGWVVSFAVVFLFGLIVGVLARYLIALLATLLVIGLIVLAAISLFAPTLLGRLVPLVESAVRVFPVSPAAFLSVGALVFAVGALVGVLLTTPLRGLDRARPSAR